jgi:hypothetical protein
MQWRATVPRRRRIRWNNGLHAAFRLRPLYPRLGSHYHKDYGFSDAAESHMHRFSCTMSWRWRG